MKRIAVYVSITATALALAAFFYTEFGILGLVLVPPALIVVLVALGFWGMLIAFLVGEARDHGLKATLKVIGIVLLVLVLPFIPPFKYVTMAVAALVALSIPVLAGLVICFSEPRRQ